MDFPQSGGKREARLRSSKLDWMPMVGWAGLDRWRRVVKMLGFGIIPRD
jgi:hypothetical protein